MKSIVSQLINLNQLVKISLLGAFLVLVTIAVGSNNSWGLSNVNLALDVSFSTSPADQDDDGVISICEGSTVTFSDTSTEVPVDAVYSWSFPGGDMTSSDTSGPHSVVFNNAGNYLVTLDIDGTTATLNVLVENSPNIDPVVVPNNWGSSTFNGSTYFTYCNDASGSTGYVTNFAFQTASTNTTANSIHTITDVNGDLIFSFVGENFDVPDQFINHAVNSGFTQITYTIEEGSCVYQSTFELYIGAAPTATISNEGIPVLCFPGSITYNIVPGAQNGPGTIYTIEVSDGSDPVVFNHPPPSTYTHTYNSVSCGQADVEFNDTVYNNAFEISITASNACDQSTNGFAPIYIESGPEASFEFNPDPPNDAVCQGTTLAAIDTTIPGSNISNGECTDYYRKFWQITAPDGSILTSTTSGALDANPFVTVAGNMGYVPGGISTSAESASSWFTTATSQIDITFLQPGNYDVTLFTGSSGQSNRCGITYFTQTICVIPEVVSNFDLSTYLVCGPVEVSSTNNSSTTDCGISNIYEWSVTATNPDNCPVSNSPDWEFANGTSASSFEPDFQFNTPGIYEVSLTVSLDIATAGTMCEPDTMTKVITIKEKPQTTLPVVELCENESYTFDLEVFDCYAEQAATFFWNFQGASGVTVSDVTSLNPTITFTTAGTYPYTLTLTNECGDNILSGSIDIFPEVLITASGPTVTCVNADIILTGSISGGTTQGTWTSSVTGGSFNPSANDLNVTYAPPIDYTGTIVFTLTSDDPVGPCPAVSDTVTVNVQPEATADAGVYDPFCVNTVIQLAGTIGGAASSATWTSDVSGTFSDPFDLSATFTPDTDFIGAITFTLTTDDPVGPCVEAIDQATVEVIPLGQVNPTSNVVYCNGNTTLPISFSTTESGTTFHWTNSNDTIGLQATGTGDIPSFTALNDNPPYEPLIATITVTPILTSGATSCAGATETFTITVNPSAQVDDPTDLVLCHNDTQSEIVFSTQNTGGATSYSWSIDESIGLSPTSGTGNIPSFTALNDNPPYEPLIATITVTPTFTNAGVTCTGVPEEFTITVNPSAQVDDPTDLVLCHNDTQSEIVFSTQNTGGTTSYSWSIDESIGLSPTSGTGNIPSFTALNDNPPYEPLIATITVTPTFTNAGVTCTGVPEEFTITVNPSAQVDDPTDLVLCHNDTQSEIVFSTQNTGGTTSYSWSIDESIGLSPTSGTGNIPSFTALNDNPPYEPLIATITVTPTFTNAGVTCTAGATRRPSR